MNSRGPRKGLASARVAAGMMAVVLGAAGCASSGEGSAAPPANVATASPSLAPPAAAASTVTVKDVVAGWVAAVIEGRDADACKLSALSESSTSPAKAFDAETCLGNGAEVAKMKKMVGQLRESFTPKNHAGAVKVEIRDIPTAGEKVTVSGDDIVINGQSLTDVVLSNSTGVEKGQLDISIDAADLDGSWYVTGFDLHVG